MQLIYNMDIKFIIDCYTLPSPRPELTQIKPCRFQDTLPSIHTLIDIANNCNITKSYQGISCSSQIDSIKRSPSQTVKPKMVRSQLSETQLKYLMAVFNKNPYPESKLKKQLALKLGISVRIIQVWFQNRRQSSKRDNTIINKV